MHAHFIGGRDDALQHHPPKLRCAVRQVGREIDREWNPVTIEDRRSDSEIVPVAIIKCEGNETFRRVALGNPPDGFVKRHTDHAALMHMKKHGFEKGRCDFKDAVGRKIRVVGLTHPMQHEDRPHALHGTRRKQRHAAGIEAQQRRAGEGRFARRKRATKVIGHFSLGPDVSNKGQKRDRKTSTQLAT